jgi:hypothetical protein
MDRSGDVIMGAQGVQVPPSPDFLNGIFEQEHPSLASPASPTLAIRKAKNKVVLNDRTGAGIKKKQPKSRGTVAKLVNATASATAALAEEPVEKPFRFMNLPGGKFIVAQCLVHILMLDRNP